jgi:hypothetical protein
MTRRRPTTQSQTPREMLAELLPVIDTVYVAGPPLVLAWTATVLFALMLAGPFALLVALVLVLVAAMAVVGLAAAILASPYLLVRHLRAHRAARVVSRPAPQLVTVESSRAAA